MTRIKLKGFVNAIRILLGAVGLGLLLVGSASAAPPDKDANVAWWWWQDPATTMEDPAGTSRIVRTDKGISGNISVHLENDTGSAHGLAITLWLVIFNDPDECEFGPGNCGSDADFGNPDIKLDVVYGGGNVVGASERATIGFHYKAGNNAGSIADIFGLPTDNGDSFGLIYPRSAEVHYVIRLHGPKDPAAMPEQIHSYGGGCTTGPLPPPLGWPFPLDSGDLHLESGDCQDVIFAINEPPE